MKQWLWRIWQRIRYGKIANHPCYVGDGELEHDWQYVSDCYGDPGVVNGTCDCSHWHCRVCDSEDNDEPAPSGDDYYWED